MSELKRFKQDCECTTREARKWFHHVQRMEKQQRKYLQNGKYPYTLPDEGTNIGCGLMSELVTFNYKEFMEGGNNAD